MGSMLKDLGVQVRSLAEFDGAPEVVEDGSTYEENALKKARSAAAFTGKPSLADDTGLEVEALDGRPGIHAARFAGEQCSFQDNITKLLTVLKGVPRERRGAATARRSGRVAALPRLARARDGRSHLLCRGRRVG